LGGTGGTITFTHNEVGCGLTPKGGHIRGTTPIGWAGWDIKTFANKVGGLKGKHSLKPTTALWYNSHVINQPVAYIFPPEEKR